VNRRTRGALGALASAALIGAGVQAVATAAPAPSAAPASESHAAARSDNHPGPLTVRQEARRKAAQKLILSGEATPNADGVVQLAEDKYYQAAVTGVDRVFTILSEFGDAGSGKLGTTPGPLHNEIPEPDRTVDNSTHWLPDFNRNVYLDLLFGSGESFADFYYKQSAGQYTVAGDVSDWVQVPGNASTYGDNAVENDGGAWQFVEDTGNAWYDAQVAAGRTDDQIKAELATYDEWDRYDYNNNGNFDEPDGYLDHFQAVHAGIGEDAGGGAQGADAIWSHRWYVNQTDFGLTGPTVNGSPVLLGGAEIGDTGYWIGDYTTEAENGGLGVFAHEYGHDLGLPDLYDTNGGDNGTGFWTLMSLGSWLSHGTVDIGTTPGHYGPWEKLQLGWLDYSVVSPGQGGAFTLSPAPLQVTGQDQALIVDVPDQGVTSEYTTAYSGAKSWWTSKGDNLNSKLTRSIDLTGISKATVTAKAWYDIEDGYDFLHAEYSTNGGANWTKIGTLTGSSNDRWATLRYTVPGGQPTMFRFRYQTDGGVQLAGAFLDDITFKTGGSTLFFDDVESGDNGWTAVGGFKQSTGTEISLGDRYYLLENRTYTGYDATLQVGPYQFDRGLTAPNHVEHFPYQDGMLVWAVDESYTDNNTIDHPGHALAMPVDARPAPFGYPDGTRPSNRRQPFDATFGLQATDAVSLHKEVLVGNGKSQTVDTLAATAPSNAGIPTFTDADPDAYWSSLNPLSSILVAGWGVTATVTIQNPGGTLTVVVNNPAS
jgi:immune inhibitor A